MGKKIVKLDYINRETWTLHLVMDEDASVDEILAAGEMALEDGNFFENANSGGDNTTILMGATVVLDSGGDSLYTVDNEGNVDDYDEA